MKWPLLLILFFCSCSPFSWRGGRNPSSSPDSSACLTTIEIFAEHTAQTPFEKRTQILYQEMLFKKTKVTYEELIKLDKQAELIEILESINSSYNLPEIDFALWAKDHSKGDLKAMLKTFKKFQTEKNISTRDIEKMTVKLYRLLNGYRPFYKKIPFYSNLQEILKQAPEEKILEAIRTRIWIEGLTSHVKNIGRYKDPSLVKKLFENAFQWNNQVKITIAVLLDATYTSTTGSLDPFYVPTLKLFNHKKMTSEILASIELNGWQHTKTILEKNFQKSIFLDRYYNLLTYTYTRLNWIYLSSITSIIIYERIENYKKKVIIKEELNELNNKIDTLTNDLASNLEEFLELKTPQEQADSFAQSLRESGIDENKINELKLKYLEASRQLEESK